MTEVLRRLSETIAARKGADAGSSYVARCLANGPEKCAEKFGEEAVEAIIEAVRNDREKLIAEAADVTFHMLIMLASRDISLAEVCVELERREGVSGLTEKASRTKAPKT